MSLPLRLVDGNIIYRIYRGIILGRYNDMKNWTVPNPNTVNKQKGDQHFLQRQKRVVEQFKPPAMDSETGALVSTSHTGLPFVWILLLLLLKTQHKLNPRLIISLKSTVHLWQRTVRVKEYLTDTVSQRNIALSSKPRTP